MSIIMRNALIEDVRLEIEDHGILTGWLILDYGDGTMQGFGGFVLDKKVGDKRMGSAFGTTFILRCLQISDVTRWFDIKGKTIRVKFDSDKNLITEIGHIIKNEWFNPREFLSNETDIANPENIKIVEEEENSKRIEVLA